MSLDLESAEWRGELEWPQEVVGSLEVGSASDDFVDETLNAGDSSAKVVSDDAVVSEWNSASVDLTIASLVDELADGLS